MADGDEDQEETTAAAVADTAAPPDTPKSETGELEKHGMAVSSLFPQLWGLASPPDGVETIENDDDADKDELISPDSVKTTTKAISPEIPQHQDEQTESAVESTLSNDSSTTVSNLRDTWKQKEQQTQPRSHLLNLNDFHMQQRKNRAGEKQKKGEAAQHLHSFRSNDTTAQQQQAAADKKQIVVPALANETKAADRAAMAQYMFLRQSKDSAAKGTAAGTAPHRTKALTTPAPELTASISGESRSLSPTSGKGTTNTWRNKSPTVGGKNAVVTDVDEFYHHLEHEKKKDERQKREILHISDHREISPDKTSSIPTGFVKSLIPALADSVVDDDDISLAMTPRASMDDSVEANLSSNVDGLVDNFNEKQPECALLDENCESEVASETEAIDEAGAGLAPVDSSSMNWEQEEEISSSERNEEASGSNGNELAVLPIGKAKAIHETEEREPLAEKTDVSFGNEDTQSNEGSSVDSPSANKSEDVAVVGLEAQGGATDPEGEEAGATAASHASNDGTMSACDQADAGSRQRVGEKDIGGPDCNQSQESEQQDEHVVELDADVAVPVQGSENQVQESTLLQSRKQHHNVDVDLNAGVTARVKSKCDEKSVAPGEESFVMVKAESVDGDLPMESELDDAVLESIEDITNVASVEKLDDSLEVPEGLDNSTISRTVEGDLLMESDLDDAIVESATDATNAVFVEERADPLEVPAGADKSTATVSVDRDLPLESKHNDAIVETTDETTHVISTQERNDPLDIQDGASKSPSTIDGDLQMERHPSCTHEVNHVPDDISNVSDGTDNSTATVDGDLPMDAEIDDAVAASVEAADVVASIEEYSDPLEVNHVPDDISNVSEGTDNSTAAVDGDLPMETEIDDAIVASVEEAAVVASIEERSDPVEVDHVPYDISNVSAGTDDSTATVDGDLPMETEIDDAIVASVEEAFVVASIEERSDPVEVDHVPDDISNVSPGTDDSTATVDGDIPMETEIDDAIVASLEEAVEGEERNEPMEVNQGPDDISNVSKGTHNSTATVDGDLFTENVIDDALVGSLGEQTTTVFEPMPFDEATEPTEVDHVRDDISIVTERSNDSTASVEGDASVADAVADQERREISATEGSNLVSEDINMMEVLLLSETTKEKSSPSTKNPAKFPELPTQVDDQTPVLVSDGDATSEHPVQESAKSVDVPTSFEVEEEANDATLKGNGSEEDDSVFVKETAVASGRISGVLLQETVTDTAAVAQNAACESVPHDEMVLDERLSNQRDELSQSPPRDVVDSAENGIPNPFRSLNNTDEVAPDDKSALEELLETEGSTEIAEIPAETVAGTGSAVISTSADDVVLEELLVENEVPFRDVGPMESSAEHKEDSETVPDDEVLDELLARSRDASTQPSMELKERCDKEANHRIAVAAIEDLVATAVVEELLASSDEVETNSSGGEGTEKKVELDHGSLVSGGLAEPIADDVKDRSTESDIARKRKSEIVSEGDEAAHVIDNILADESTIAASESVQSNNAVDPALQAHDISGLNPLTATRDVSSKDTKDDMPSAEGNVQIKAGPSDERIEVVPLVSNAGSSASSVTTTTDSSDEGAPPLSCAPSAGSTDKPVAKSPGAKIEVDYKSADYRGFVFVVHKAYGLMLLHCTRKKKKGPHFQLPGGHIDEPEFFAAAEESRDGQTQLLLAARAGAARELYEETGMDTRHQLDRLEPAALRNDVEFDKKGKPVLKNELKHRLYFFLPVTDDDYWSSDKGDSDAGKIHPMGAARGCEGSHLMLRLSVEHQGWTFEKDPRKSVEMLAVHSGGNGAIALRMSMARGSSGMEEAKAPFDEKDEKMAADKELQSETWETEPLTKDDATGEQNQDATNRAAPADLLPPPEQSVISKLFSCCLWFQHSE